MDGFKRIYRVVAVRSDGAIASRLRVRGLGIARMIAAMWRLRHGSLNVRIERPADISDADILAFDMKVVEAPRASVGFR